MRDLFSVAGKTALVTGGTSGIGHMIAQGFVESGVRTYIVGRNTKSCEETAAELSANGSCIPLAGDLSQTSGIDALVADFAEAEDRLHVLVNNAGALSDAPLDSFTEEDWDRVVDLNVKSVFFLTQKLLPFLRKGAGVESPAAVINIGSVGGLRVGPRETYSYQVAKAGLHHLTHSLARRLGPENITVNAIAPGFFPSRMTQITSDAMREAVVAQIPRRRVGEGDDVAGLAIFLASRAGAFVTGTVIPLDGGMSA